MPLLDPDQTRTLLVTVSALVFLIIYSAFAAIRWGAHCSGSWVFAVLSRRFPAVPFGFAMLGGHIFGVSKDPAAWSRGAIFHPDILWMIAGLALGAFTASQQPDGDRGRWPLQDRRQWATLVVWWTALFGLAAYDGWVAATIGGGATISWTFHLLAGPYRLFPLLYGFAMGRLFLVRWARNWITVEMVVGVGLLLLGSQIGRVAAAQHEEPEPPREPERTSS